MIETRTVVDKDNKTPIKVLRVKKMGKHTLTLEDGTRWRLSDCMPLGSDFWTALTRIRCTQPDDAASIEHAKRVTDLCHRINRIRWDHLPIETLKAVLDVVGGKQ